MTRKLPTNENETAKKNKLARHWPLLKKILIKLIRWGIEIAIRYDENPEFREILQEFFHYFSG